MKHHLYQIYFGGWYEKLPNHYYCETCNAIITNSARHKKTFLSDDE